MKYQVVIQWGIIAVALIVAYNFRYKIFSFLKQRIAENKEISQIKRKAYVNKLKEMAQKQGEVDAEESVKKRADLFK